MKLIEYFKDKATKGLPHEPIEKFLPDSNLLEDCVESGLDTLGIAILYNDTHDLDLSESDFDYLIEHSNLKRHHIYGNNLFLTLRYKALNKKQTKYLLYKSDLTQSTPKGATAFMAAFRQSGLLENQDTQYLLDHSNLKQARVEGWDALMYWITGNRSEGINLNAEQKEYLIRKSSLQTVSNYPQSVGKNALMMALENNKSEFLALSPQQWTYMLEHSDLQQVTEDGSDALIIAIRNHGIQNLRGVDFDYLIRHSNLGNRCTEGKNALWRQLASNNAPELSVEQMNFMLDNSEIYPVDGASFFELALMSNSLKETHFTSTQLEHLKSFCPSILNSEMQVTLLAAERDKLIRLTAKLRDFIIRQPQLKTPSVQILSCLKPNKSQMQYLLEQDLGGIYEGKTFLSLYLKNHKATSVVVRQAFTSPDMIKAQLEILTPEQLAEVFPYIENIHYVLDNLPEHPNSKMIEHLYLSSKVEPSCKAAYVFKV